MKFLFVASRLTHDSFLEPLGVFDDRVDAINAIMDDVDKRYKHDSSKDIYLFREGARKVLENGPILKSARVRSLSHHCYWFLNPVQVPE